MEILLKLKMYIYCWVFISYAYPLFLGGFDSKTAENDYYANEVDLFNTPNVPYNVNVPDL